MAIHGSNFQFPKAVLTWADSGNTVIRMTTLTFKVPEDEARNLRAAARQARLTLSEYLRRQIHTHRSKSKPLRQIRCPHTKALIFAPAPQHPKLSTASVREMLADFP